MSIRSCLVLPHEGKKTELAQVLLQFDQYEVVPVENKDILIFY